MMKKISLILFLGIGLGLFSGCQSDALAPHDAAPALTEQDSANQAGFVAFAVAQVGPLAVTYDQKSEVYTFPVGSEVQGSVELDFRTGGAQGAPSTPSAADYAAISTMGDDGLTIESPLGGMIHLTANLMASISRGTNDSATLLAGSGGTLDAGAYTASFTMSDLTVFESGYPTGGPIVFDNGYHTLELNFNGTHLVSISLDGDVINNFDLDSMGLQTKPRD